RTEEDRVRATSIEFVSDKGVVYDFPTEVIRKLEPTGIAGCPGSLSLVIVRKLVVLEVRNPIRLSLKKYEHRAAVGSTVTNVVRNRITLPTELGGAVREPGSDAGQGKSSDSVPRKRRVVNVSCGFYACVEKVEHDVIADDVADLIREENTVVCRW